jgi:hypothetical protein
VDFPVDWARIAQIALQTLRKVFRIYHPGTLQCKSFSRDGAQIRFPNLHIKRERT